ncbi:DUF2391 family protein [Candidatus Woesearchaeota archaeon]|nr:DUF2391 family protein [Candidatus Woesearchaeota archaeon]
MDKKEVEADKKRIVYSILHHRPEFHPKDLLQVMIGASILAIPVGFTEETWELGEILPLLNIILLMALSIFFISAFVYYNYHKHHRLEKHWTEFIKRVISTYVFSFLVVALLLTLIQKTPWMTDWLLAVKRIIIVTFPSSMSAVVADVIK